VIVADLPNVNMRETSQETTVTDTKWSLAVCGILFLVKEHIHKLASGQQFLATSANVLW